MPTINVLRYGSDDPLSEQRSLRAGPLRLIYEGGDLRYIKLGEHEVVRRIYVAVRDRNWGTIPAQLLQEHVEADDASFRITYDVMNQQDELAFAWRGEIVGERDGAIRFSMDGEARSTFLRNRIGFCVLYPAASAGAECQIEHVDGRADVSEFPRLIAPQLIENGRIQPHYPFAEMRALAHKLMPGEWAELRFAGEIFELEDQRNWIDGSYKAYGTPLRLPFPVEIAAGTKVHQAITLTLKDERSVAGDDDVVQAQPFSMFALQRSSLPIPRIGLGMASHGQTLSAAEITRLQALRPAHLRVDLQLPDPGSVDRLEQATREARALGVSLEAAIFVSNKAEAELCELRAALDRIDPPIAAWLIFYVEEITTSPAWVRLARAHLTAYAPEAVFASGTNAYFADLNRARPQTEAPDAIVYSVNPQVHAFDNTSLAETPEVIGMTIESARQFSADKPIIISPITLKPRFNPVATGPECQTAPGELPPQVDPRQMSLFGACWTLASLKYLVEHRAASATYYETTGWRGVLERATGSPLPKQFPSLPGAVFPLYHVLADVNEFAEGTALHTTSSDVLRVNGLAMQKDGVTRILLANMTNSPQLVRAQLPAETARLRVLDERNAESAMRDPERFRAEDGTPIQLTDGDLELTLRPYAIARIDVQEYWSSL
jgi:D-apionolactonase